jgi:hypothetical protein
VYLKIDVMTQAIPDAIWITVSAMVVLAVDKPVLVINCFLPIHQRSAVETVHLYLAVSCHEGA